MGIPNLFFLVNAIDPIKYPIDQSESFLQYINKYVKICIENKPLAILVTLVCLIIIFFNIYKNIGFFISEIKQRKKTTKIFIFTILFFSLFISYYLVESVNTLASPKPDFTKYVESNGSRIIIGPPSLEWEYSNPNEKIKPGYRRAYQLQKKEVVEKSNSNWEHYAFITEGRAYDEEGIFNKTYTYRVRAGIIPEEEYLKPLNFKPTSPWSSPELTLTSYDGVIKKIKMQKKILVGFSNSFKQGIFKYQLRNGANGVDLRLAKYIARDICLNINKDIKDNPKSIDNNYGNIVAFPCKKIMNSGENKSINELLESPSVYKSDIIISALSKSIDRENKYDIIFSKPYYITNLTLIGMKINKTKDISDSLTKDDFLNLISGRSIGVKSGTTSQIMLEEFNESNQSKVKIIIFDDYDIAIDKMLSTNDGIDFVLTDYPFFDFYKDSSKLISQKDRIFSSKLQFTSEEYAVAVKADQKELLDSINKTISNLEDNGVLKKIKDCSKNELVKKYNKLLGQLSPDTETNKESLKNDSPCSIIDKELIDIGLY